MQKLDNFYSQNLTQKTRIGWKTQTDCKWLNIKLTKKWIDLVSLTKSYLSNNEKKPKKTPNKILQITN